VSYPHMRIHHACGYIADGEHRSMRAHFQANGAMMLGDLRSLNCEQAAIRRRVGRRLLAAWQLCRRVSRWASHHAYGAVVSPRLVAVPTYEPDHELCSWHHAIQSGAVRGSAARWVVGCGTSLWQQRVRVWSRWGTHHQHGLWASLLRAGYPLHLRSGLHRGRHLHGPRTTYLLVD
jgi:hypothetical protein